jgi:hypothetical protein
MDSIAYLKNQYLYLINNDTLSYISIRGIFEIPTEAYNFYNNYLQKKCYDLNDPYPIPIDKVAILKEMILSRELGIQVSSASDNVNDSDSKFEQNIKGIQQTRKN